MCCVGYGERTTTGVFVVVVEPGQMMSGFLVRCPGPW